MSIDYEKIAKALGASRVVRLGGGHRFGITPVGSAPVGVSLRLPYPPSLNNLYATVGRRRVLTAEGRAYKQHVGVLAAQARIRPLHGDVKLSFVAYRPRRCGDLSNLLKIVEDGLKGFAYDDDGQIAEIHAVRREDKADPRVIVIVTSLPAAPTEEPAHAR